MQARGRGTILVYDRRLLPDILEPAREPNQIAVPQPLAERHFEQQMPRGASVLLVRAVVDVPQVKPQLLPKIGR